MQTMSCRLKMCVVKQPRVCRVLRTYAVMLLLLLYSISALRSPPPPVRCFLVFRD